MGKLGSYFSFRGRVNRLRYWLTNFAFYGLLVVASPLATVLPLAGRLIGVVAIFAGLWAVMAVSAQRLHDRGKSAWWLLGMYFPVLILSVWSFILDMSGSATETANVLDLLTVPFSIWAVVELGILKGMKGENRFGPDPLASGPGEVFA